MKFISSIFFAILSTTFASSSAKSEETQSIAQTDWTYKISPITRIEDGRLHFKKLFFNEACNEKVIQILTQPQANGDVQIGILSGASDQSCNQPPRERMERYYAERSHLVPVSRFEQIWFCDGYCYDYSQPGTPSYSYSSNYGTSHQQAANMPCKGSIVKIQCQEIHIPAEN